MTNYYNIDDGYGHALAAGLQPHLARRVAQEKADERGESVWLYDPCGLTDEDGVVESEEIESSDKES